MIQPQLSERHWLKQGQSAELATEEREGISETESTPVIRLATISPIVSILGMGLCCNRAPLIVAAWGGKGGALSTALGTYALMEIKQSGERGGRLAVTAIVSGVIELLAAVLAVLQAAIMLGHLCSQCFSCCRWLCSIGLDTFS
jgi:hypothetical protein